MTSAEWGEAWKQRQKLRNTPHDADYWNKRSATYGHKDSPNSYTYQFIQLSGILPGETVFDMGCGTGNLSIPLGKSGHEVIAADFSEGMLTQLEEQLNSKAIHTVKPLQLSWDDDWTAKGIKPNSFDVCLASRSIITGDLRDSLLKLASVAKRRVCITLSTGVSPRIDMPLMAELGIATPQSFDPVYALAILLAEGYFPELTYIKTTRDEVFDGYDDALEKFTTMVDMALENAQRSNCETPDRENALAQLHNWLDKNLIPAENFDDTLKEPLQLKQPRKTIWAFVSFDKD